MNTSTTIPSPDMVRDSWDRIATDFDRFTTPITVGIGEAALDRLRLEPGTRFLDIAAGSGALAIPAARRGARVLAIDSAPTMIQRLRDRARGEGLANLEARVMDGNALDLENDGFDVSGSLNGVSLFPDLRGGVGEMVRVTRPGGRVLIAAFGPMPSVEFVDFFMRALVASVPGARRPPADPPPLPFQLADVGKLRQVMAGVGLSDIRVETLDWTTEFASAASYWNVITSSNPIVPRLLSGLTDEQIRTIRLVTDGMVGERSRIGPAVLHNRINIGIGRK